MTGVLLFRERGRKSSSKALDSEGLVIERDRSKFVARALLWYSSSLTIFAG